MHGNVNVKHNIFLYILIHINLVHRFSSHFLQVCSSTAVAAKPHISKPFFFQFPLQNSLCFALFYQITAVLSKNTKISMLEFPMLRNLNFRI
jgi:hypothetical protein